MLTEPKKGAAMGTKLTVLFIAAVSAGTITQGVASSPATQAIPYLWQNCTHVHTRYPHGVGKLFARDRTSGTPVTNFKQSTRLYNIAMRYNRGLDRDKDGIACEKH
jgi:hypothetical protein